jgi:ribosome biogenesis GTPase
MIGEAIVVKNAGSHFMLSMLPEWRPFPALLRGKIRLGGSQSTNPVSVGDRVRFEVPDVGEAAKGKGVAEARGRANGGRADEKGAAAEKGGMEAALEGVDMEHPAVITEVLDRKNCLVRKSANLSKQSHVIAANIDMAYIVVTLYFPEVKLPFLDRVLVMSEVYDVPVTIVLNKIDLYKDQAPNAVAGFHDIYEGAGYRILETSAVTGEGVDTLRREIAEDPGDGKGGRLCLFTGESGVGKSSLVKAIDPSLNPKISEISEAHLQGRHTTSLYEMYKLASGGYVIDSPGLRGFGLTGLKKEEIALYFPEMFKISKDCRFSPCTHTHEPGCAVKKAVEEGIISAERYNSYLGMLEDDEKFRSAE